MTPPPPPLDRIPVPHEFREEFGDEFQEEARQAGRQPSRWEAPEVVRREAPPEMGRPATPVRPAGDRRRLDRAVRPPPTSLQLVRRALSTPQAARQALLLREILGPPVGLCAPPGDRPS